jgi:HlyD family secretion protein
MMDNNEPGTEEIAPVIAETAPPAGERRLTLPVLGGVALLVLVGVALVATRNLQDRAPVVTGTVTASGVVEARTVQVTCEVGGILVELPVVPGQEVQAGELVAVVSSEASAAEVEQARQAVTLAQERLKQAEEALKQQEAVVSGDRQQPGARGRGGQNEAAAEVTAARAKVRQTAAAVESARAQVRQLEGNAGEPGGGRDQAAEVAAARSRLANLEAAGEDPEVAQAQAAVRAAEAAANRAEKDYDRARTLSQQGAVSPEQLEGLSAAREQAAAELRSARERLARLKSGGRAEQIAAARATLQQAEAAQKSASPAPSPTAAGSRGPEASQARAALARAVAAHETAQAQLAQIEAGARGSGPQAAQDEMTRQILAEANRQILEIRRTEVQAAQAQWQQAQATLVAAEATVDKYRITAPVSGLVGQVFGVLGEVVKPGAALATVVDYAETWVRVQVPAEQMAAIRVGDHVEVRTSELPDSLTEGSVRQIDTQPAAEITAGTGRGVEIALTNPQQRLQPGMAVEAVIHTGGSRRAAH